MVNLWIAPPEEHLALPGLANRASGETIWRQHVAAHPSDCLHRHPCSGFLSLSALARAAIKADLNCFAMDVVPTKSKP